MDEKNNLTSQTNRTTPLMEQYNKIKKEYRDYVLFFRLGDFYEMFGDDAAESAPLLGIVLTKRQGVHMCGVPHHSASNYIRQLLLAGKKIAICEQLTNSEQKEGQSSQKLIEREVVRVITPGTVWEDNLLESAKNNFIISVFSEDEKSFAFVAADISTQEVYAASLSSECLASEIIKLKPREIVLPDSQRTKLPGVLASENISISHAPDWHFDETYAACEVTSLTGIKNWKMLGLDGFVLIQKALGGLLSYLKQIRCPDLGSIIKSVTLKHSAQTLLIDASALRNLEILTNIQNGGKENTLINTIDFCCTPIGSRLIKKWVTEPLIDKHEIIERQDAVRFFVENSPARKELRAVLTAVGDVERILTRLAAGSASARELCHLGCGLRSAASIKQLILSQKELFLPTLLKETTDKIDSLDEVVLLIEKSINPDAKDVGYIKEGYIAELDELKKLASNAKEVILELEKKERARTKINSLKIGYNSIFGYYVEVTKANLAMVPDEYTRKQTLVNAERFVLPELTELEKRIFHASQKAETLEKEILSDIRKEVISKRQSISDLAKAIGVIDVLLAFAEVSAQKNWIRPEINDSDIIEISDCRHPVVESKLKKGEFIPNDVLMDSSQNQIIILTGPNMAGKSTYLRQVALCIILAQAGCYIPAAAAKIGAVDKIFTRIGSADNLSSGESTFMVEMIETANILRNMTPRSLIILDEVGRGTSTYDGISIARAVLEQLHSKFSDGGPKVLFATHYFELTDMPNSFSRIKNFNVKVAEWKGDVVFMHKIEKGAADKSYGIHVAKLAGMPQQVIDRSRKILAELLSGAATFSKRESARLSPEVKQDFEDFIIFDKLKEVEVNNLTPLEALNILSDLVKDIKGRR